MRPCGIEPHGRFIFCTLPVELSQRKNKTERLYFMLGAALLFLVIALIAAFFGFGGVAGTAASIAQILFFVFLILFLVSLFMGRGRLRL